MVTEPDTNRPYAPPSNVVALLQRIRSRNVPERIDADYLLDAGISGGTVTRALFAMRFIGLIGEGGEPTEALRTINTATDEEYLATLAGLIRDAYVEVFNAVDPATEAQDRILNVFRRYTPASQRSRQVMFFLGMCREAGIPVLDAPRQRHMAEPGARQARPPVAKRQTAQQQANKPRATKGMNPALQGLIDALPPEGTVLSEAKRNQWLSMAEAALAFVYPEQEEQNVDASKADTGASAPSDG